MADAAREQPSRDDEDLAGGLSRLQIDVRLLCFRE
jgi:hypothetical protein